METKLFFNHGKCHEYGYYQVCSTSMMGIIFEFLVGLNAFFFHYANAITGPCEISNLNLNNFQKPTFWIYWLQHNRFCENFRKFYCIIEIFITSTKVKQKKFTYTIDEFMGFRLLEFSVKNGKGILSGKRWLAGSKNIQQAGFNFWIFYMKYTSFEKITHIVVDHTISVTEEMVFLCHFL